MLGKKAPGASSTPLKKGQTPKDALPERKKPDVPKTASPARKATAGSKPNGIPTKSSKSPGLKSLSPAPTSESSDKAKQTNRLQKPPKPAEKVSMPKETEAEDIEKIDDADIPSESIEKNDGPLELVDNAPGSIEEEDEVNEEQREDAVKEPPQASRSAGRSYLQRGKDAASGLANFASKANKLHSQLPDPVKKEAANGMQTGVQSITTTLQPAADGAGGKVEEITEKAPALPVDLSSLSGLEVGEDGMILDGDGNQIGRLAEGEAEALAGQTVGEDGNILDEDGDLIGRVELVNEDLAEKTEALPDQDSLGLKGLANLPLAEDGSVKDSSGRVLGKLVEGNPEELVGWTVDENGEILDDDGDLVGRVELLSSGDAGEQLDQVEDLVGESLPNLSILKDKTINEEGKILDEDGGVLGQIKEDLDPEALAGKVPNEQGQILDDDGEIIGEVEVVPGEVADKAMAIQQEAAQMVENDISILDGLQVNEEGQITDSSGTVLGELEDGDLSENLGMTVNEKGLVLDDDGNILGKARLVSKEAIEEPEKTAEGNVPELPPLSTLEGLKCNKLGKIINEDGIPVGELVEGDPKKLSREGIELDDQGQFWDNRGNIIGKAQALPAEDEEEQGPFADFDEPFVAEEGWVHDANGNTVGQVVEGEIGKLLGRAVDDDGDILDKRGNLLGRAEPWEEPEPEPEEDVDLSELEGLTPNKIGNVIGPDGVPVAQISEGDPKVLAGRKIDAEGQIWGDGGEVIGRVTLIPEDEREAITPFGGTGDLVARKTGFVEDEFGEIVGKIIEGDPQKLQGLLVDDDGDIIDKRGNVIGRAEPYTPPEEEEEEEDLSSLEGMKVNKLGNVVDEHGSVWGRLISGNPKKLAGKQVDAEGQVWSDDGKVLGSVELIPESEREQAEGIFYGLEGLVVTKDGTVTDSTGQIVGRLVEGDALRLKGRAVDEDGEVIDKLGNVIGRSEPWIPEEKPRDINPMSGRKVNREGEVRDEDGNLIGQLTEGNLKSLAGKAIDDNGYIVDNDGNKIGECTLLEHLPEPEPEPEPEQEEPELSPEELEQKEKEEHDRDLAKKMSSIVQQTLDSVEPLCKQITEHIERADRTPRDELDEEQLVKTVKPIIEEAGNMLQECKGSLRALDPDGQIAASAKARSVAREATSEEYQLADLLKQLSQTISTTIENGRRRIADMPHAKKKINPLWSLLSEPLFQIIAAVGLLLSGVLGLLGNLLDGLGLGGLVRGLLGGLGIDNLLGSLGLGKSG
ncbi:hypothetical protein N7448_010610 [Penicillium atrosanguineum]|uniref:DUF6987 domain-containing protein n=1 Tax=Penicillium atrosanguineum TaxID=1132637 RepID=A0A9W9GGL5_9EURO|nr:uncharacterized protein N7443_007833 [Penicillium atrosanguineum]KAJ5118903.1 hypothetical protein N7526_010540 [Penicillium atrosanguineum]KAJ5119941.1 hypothetical protein N7448_010610 [Penicillium atrosanguineum]KAJ5296940.1 hypothetical protein N7443_007833 [Penicillium atrosanguineum]KAJ5299701.1 hypothetical protein N7476_011258 [Penicillium atrosanguineum]